MLSTPGLITDIAMSGRARSEWASYRLSKLTTLFVMCTSNFQTPVLPHNDLRLLADAVAAQEAGVRALAADVQRLLAEDLVVAASAASLPETAHAAVDHLLGTIVHELGGLAGACGAACLSGCGTSGLEDFCPASKFKHIMDPTARAKDD